MTIGTALVGIAALAFTLVMFAIQVNVERVPHGLFRRVSRDARLLLCFAGTLLVALVVAILPLIVDEVSPGLALWCVLSACLEIGFLLLLAYARALELISPSGQLRIMTAVTARSLNRTARRARRLAPLLELAPEEKGPGHPNGQAAIDKARAALFAVDTDSAREASKAASYSMSMAARFAELGDYEASELALDALVTINGQYIRAKGKTFLDRMPLAVLSGISVGSDRFVLGTLENLRQYTAVAVARRDERQIEQVFRAFENLAKRYVTIQYAVGGDSRHHASLAAGYLAQAVKATIALQSPDVLMQGARHIGWVGRLLLAHGVRLHPVTLSDELHALAMAGVSEPKLRVVIPTVMEEYTSTLLALLVTEKIDVGHAAKHLQERVAAIALSTIQIPETSVLGEHSAWLAPFYSTSSTTSLAAGIARLTDALRIMEPDDDRAIFALRNVKAWLDKLWEPHRILLQRAVQAESKLTPDLIHWVSDVSQAAIVLAEAPLSKRHAADLRRSASWLASTLGWIPHDTRSIQFATHFGLLDQMFEIAACAQGHGAARISDEMQQAMLHLALSAEAEKADQSLLAEAIQGLCVLAVTREEEDVVDKLVAALERALSGGSGPSEGQKQRTAASLLERDQGITRIAYAAASARGAPLSKALSRCADVLQESLGQPKPEQDTGDATVN